MNSNYKSPHHRLIPPNPAVRRDGLYITRKMRTALLMIHEDNHYICEWQTIVRLMEAGFVSYIDGRACITQEGLTLLQTPPPPGIRRALIRKPNKSSPRLQRGKRREGAGWEEIAKKYDRYG